MASMTTQGKHSSTGQGVNWRRVIFYVIEVVYAIIAGTGEGYMYAAYNAPGSLRWGEAIARAVITQFAIVFFGVAAVEAARWHGAAKVWGMLGSWTATFVASLITFWFLLDAARVFRDSAMLAPLNGASIPLPNGASIPNAVIDIVVVAALPFFQLGLNILAPIITADHAPESLEAQAERQQREEAQAAHKARMTALRAQSIGAALHAGYTSAKGAVVTQETPGNADGETPGNADGETHDNESARAGNDSGPTNITKLPKRGMWKSRDLKAYAQATYGVTVGDVEAQSTMRTLSNQLRSGTSYIAPSRVVKSWVDATYSSANTSEKQRA